MNIVKEKESEMICRHGEVQPVDSFCGTFDIWFTSKTGDEELTEGLASDFTDADGVYNTFDDVIEKYLIEFDFLNPFIILFRQGIIGIIFTIICAFIQNRCL